MLKVSNEDMMCVLGGKLADVEVSLAVEEFGVLEGSIGYLTYTEYALESFTLVLRRP